MRDAIVFTAASAAAIYLMASTDLLTFSHDDAIDKTSPAIASKAATLPLSRSKDFLTVSVESRKPEATKVAATERPGLKTESPRLKLAFRSNIQGKERAPSHVGVAIADIDTKTKEPLKTTLLRPETLRPEIKAKPIIKDKKKGLLNISRGNTRSMELALTFDGGYKAQEASMILDTLKAKGIKTTVFITGSFIKNFPDLVKRIVSEGHEVGNHTMNHLHFTDYKESFRHRTLPNVDRDFVIKELTAAADLFREVTGKEMAPYWRAPYGETNVEISHWANEAGFMHVGWTFDNETKKSLDTLDWIDDETARLYLTAAEIKNRIIDFDKHGHGLKGGIILMHLGTERKAEQAATILGDLIDDITGRGYRFVRVSEIHRALKLRDKKDTRLAMKKPY